MIPKFVAPVLWSYDLKNINPRTDKKRIILNVLNYGSQAATDWLFKYYQKKDIKDCVVNFGAKGELSPKSLNYWTIILKINPKKLVKARF
jgi:hypothetical protein